jgi:hypothetical protein
MSNETFVELTGATVGGIRNERWLDSVGHYFQYHNIQERFLLTFHDFTRIVESGRWTEFISGMRLLEPRSFLVTIDNKEVNLFVSPEHGYTVSTKWEGAELAEKTFGSSSDAREKALNWYQKELG